MKAYALSLGTFKVKVQTGRAVRFRASDVRVHLDETLPLKIMATVEHAALAVLMHLNAKYEAYRVEKTKLELEQYPQHTLFCDGEECQLNLFNKYLARKGTR